ncbi:MULTISPECIES: outer membrane beta-barrel protein [unclassified Methylobacterium]|uniref:outer membrane protein n=1 Tax=unclassified Methylobacterium TaxID=2615210 RepID=UPI0006FAC977|nr:MULTISPECIES: outer membrane beta-barrel protein [unclassified Methylobacterium]KQP90988.1 porin [Methylobacterium sp. Leaf113]KQP92048.1 porin [Methylobacterium sp. Leaf117]MCK2054309.1 porin family protein [Methylobacterium sp. 37f]
MRRTKLSALARSITLIVSVAAPCLAQAADLLPPLPPEPLPPPVEIGGGWYLRGDVGVGATNVGAISTTVHGEGLPSGYRYDQKSVEDSYFAGGGVGYQFGSYFHGDITAEYRGGSKFRFQDSYDSVCGGDNAYPCKGVNAYNANLSSVVVMANGYIDLGTWYGVTPFVGGGVGTAFHRLSGFNDSGFGAASGGYGYAKDKNTNTFAWAAMAGLGYSVTPNVKLELGYRYMNLGHVGSNPVTCINDPGCGGAVYKIKDITSHDVRIGMRWLLGGVVAPAVVEYQPEPAPLIRKY